MESAIDRVMQAYALMANLTAEEVQATREKLAKHLEGLRYLRGPDRPHRVRRKV
jgi:hypothetical protein